MRRYPLLQRKNSLFLALTLLFLGSPASFADWQSAVTSIPPVFPPEIQQKFEGKKKGLEQTRQEIFTLAGDLSGRCTDISEDDTGTIQECMNLKGTIETKAARYETDWGVFKSDLIAALDKEIAQSEARRNETREQIEGLHAGFKGNVQAIEEWVQMSKEARKEAIQALGEVAMTFFLERLQELNDLKSRSMISLDEQKSKEAGRLIQKIVLRNPTVMKQPWFKQRGWHKALVIKTEGDLLFALDKLNDGLSLKTRPEGWKDNCENLLTALDLISPTPAVSFISTGAKLGIASTYAHWTRDEALERVRQLGDLSADQLKALDKLMDLYIKDIERLKMLKAEKEKVLAQ